MAKRSTRPRAQQKPRTADEAMRTCFVIMPYGKKWDEARKKVTDFDKVFDAIIQPAIDALKDENIPMKCVRADKIAQAGFIHERMIRMIADADVSIADLTTGNANVFYELGVRHSLRDRVTVLLRQRRQKNPFNLYPMATIDYDMSEPSVERAKLAITSFVRNGLHSGTPDSLVHAVLPGLKISGDTRMISASQVEEYDIPRMRGRRLGIVAGNLRYANLSQRLRKRPIDVWLSSENINMDMARPYDQSVSGLIRYLGAKKDATGTVDQDTIAAELKRRMGKRQLVNPGQVVSTGAGQLEETHRVKRIYHAAAVYGVVGTGFHPIAQVEQCITNALTLLDSEAKSSKKGRKQSSKDFESILFPLLGTGTARGDLVQSARRQIEAVTSYLRARGAGSNVRRVYFLAPTKRERVAVQVAFAELGMTDPIAGGVRRSPPQTAGKRPATQPKRRGKR